MASLNQLISEISHSLGQPNNYALRQNIRNIIIHERNEKIRRSYSNHGYVDKVLLQRFAVELIIVNDGDIELPIAINNKFKKIKRTKNKVPRPVRLINNLPFNRVSTAGVYNSIEIPYIQETRAQFRKYVPGLCGSSCYDYINDYIYLFYSNSDNLITNNKVDDVNKIILEAAWEIPHEVAKLNNELSEYDFNQDDWEYFIPEDMIGIIKDSIYKRNLLDVPRETNEISNQNKVI